MPTMKRLLDVSIALCGLILLSPVFLVAAIGIKLTSPGPILYRAQRIGRDRRRSLSERRRVARERERRQAGYRGLEFTLYKFRTMRVSESESVPITAWKDSRVFPFGRWLRATKIDELPQLVNVLKGDMALVGPRPEAPEIVRSHYTQDDLGTLQILPGVTSPGTVYYYTHCEETLQSEEVVDTYVQRLLPLKLAIDRVYIGRATVLYDLRVVARTVGVLVARCFGSHRFSDPPELARASVRSPSQSQSPTSPANDAPQ